MILVGWNCVFIIKNIFNCFCECVVVVVVVVGFIIMEYCGLYFLCDSVSVVVGE